MNHDLDSRLHVILAIALLSIIVGGTADLVMDNPASWLSFHVIFETLMIAGALVMATTLWLGWWRSAHSAAELRESLRTQRDERDAWRRSRRPSSTTSCCRRRSARRRHGSTSSRESRR